VRGSLVDGPTQDRWAARNITPSTPGTGVVWFPLDDVYVDVEQVDDLAADGGVGFLERHACLGRQGP
jgi:hypothetical protein